MEAYFPKSIYIYKLVTTVTYKKLKLTQNLVGSTYLKSSRFKQKPIINNRKY